LLMAQVPAGQPWKGTVPVPKGTYFLMIDHSPAVGQTAPPAIQGDDRAARVDYVAEVGDKP
jgi:hypothetical protein